MLDLRSLWDKAVHDAEDRRFESAILGALDGTSVSVAGRVGYNYARRGPNGELGEIIVKNAKVAPVYGTPVKIRLEAGQWVVKEADAQFGDPDVDPGEGGVYPHATTHQHGGSDEVATATPAANAIIKADADGKIGAGWIDDADINLDNVTEGATNKFYTATEKTKLAGIEAGADVTDAANIASSITGASTDDTIVDADVWGYLTSGSLVKTTWANIKAVLKTYFDTLYNLYVHPNHTGDVTSVGDGATTIGANKVLTAMIADAQVTLAKMANLAQATIIGRASGAGTGVPTALSAAQVVAIIQSSIDHGGLAGLGDDDHTQYLQLAGRSGGQRVTGIASTGYALEVYRNMAASNTDSPVLGVIQDAATDDQPALYVRNDATTGDTALFVKDGTGNSLVKFATYSATASHRSVFFLQRARGSLATPGIISSGDLIGDFVFYAHDGTDFREAAKISVVSDGTPGASDMPGRMDFYTTPDGSATPAIAQRINSSQQAMFGGLSTMGGGGFLATKAGTSSNDAAVGGTLYVTTTTVGQVGAGPDVLASYSVPANTLSVNNQSLWWEACGEFDIVGPGGVITIEFGGTTICTINAGLSGPWSAWGRIFRTGATSQKAISWQIDADNDASKEITTPAETLSGAVTFRIRGDSGSDANDDTTCEYFIVGWDDANT